MAALRAIFVIGAIVGFFLVGAPLQWLFSRFAPRAAHVLPLAFCRTLLALLRVEVVSTGAQAAGPLVVAANHISWIDILAFGSIRPFCFLAKSEVESWPMVSAFAGVQGTVFVDRERRRTIPRANRELGIRILEGRAALLFPEATTLAGPLPGRFHSSHFAAARDLLARDPGRGKVAVQPAAIAYSSPGAAWVGTETLLSHVWRTLREPPLTCRIAFGAPIEYGRASDRKIVAAAAREAIVAMLVTYSAERVTTAVPFRPAETGDAVATRS